MKNDLMDISNRLKNLENAVLSNDNAVIVNLYNRQGKIAYSFKFKPIKAH